MSKLRLEQAQQQIALQEKQKFITFAHTVAHDIISPLTALSMLTQMCDELPEDKRKVLSDAVTSMLDIMNNLLGTYSNEDQRATPAIESRQPLLISDLLGQLLCEKKAQFCSRSVRLEIVIAHDAQFAFALMQPSQFRRSISNLINNAVDAIGDKENGIVTIQLAVNEKSVIVSIQDNGKGMSSSMVEKMLTRQSFIEDKEHGHGIGLQQIWNTVDRNEGQLTVCSMPGKGSTIQLSFLRVEAPL